MENSSDSICTTAWPKSSGSCPRGRNLCGTNSGALFLKKHIRKGLLEHPQISPSFFGNNMWEDLNLYLWCPFSFLSLENPPNERYLQSTSGMPRFGGPLEALKKEQPKGNQLGSASRLEKTPGRAGMNQTGLQKDRNSETPKIDQTLLERPKKPLSFSSSGPISS